jgi:hypothetical protein
MHLWSKCSLLRQSVGMPLMAEQIRGQCIYSAVPL